MSRRTGIGGPHVQGLLKDLGDLTLVCQKKSKAPLANPELTPEVIVVEEEALMTTSAAPAGSGGGDQADRSHSGHGQPAGTE